MEIIEIGKEQLVFLLSEGDMKKYDIDSDEETRSLKEGFKRLLSDMKVDNRFRSGVLVQIFNSQNGGCEMFVTKMPDSTDLDNPDSNALKSFIYLFDDLTMLFSACKALSGQEKQKSVVYINENEHKYYLFLEREWTGAGEFFGRRCKENAREYITERGRFLCRGAIETLSPLA